jgi:hypothetical protein
MRSLEVERHETVVASDFVHAFPHALFRLVPAPLARTAEHEINGKPVLVIRAPCILKGDFLSGGRASLREQETLPRRRAPGLENEQRDFFFSSALKTPPTAFRTVG